MAMMSPAGTEKLNAMAEVRSVPARSGHTPKCLSRKRGVHSVSKRSCERETSLKKRTLSIERTVMIPAVVKTESELHPRRNDSIVERA